MGVRLGQIICGMEAKRYVMQPEFVDVIRNPDGTADWRLNFDNIYAAFNHAREYFKCCWQRDLHIIEYLVSKRAALRRDKQFDQADEIKNVLLACGVTLEDSPGPTRWHIEHS